MCIKIIWNVRIKLISYEKFISCDICLLIHNELNIFISHELKHVLDIKKYSQSIIHLSEILVWNLKKRFFKKKNKFFIQSRVWKYFNVNNIVNVVKSRHIETEYSSGEESWREVLINFKWIMLKRCVGLRNEILNYSKMFKTLCN